MAFSAIHALSIWIASSSRWAAGRIVSVRMLMRLTPQISDAPMRVTQNTFMVGARSLHLLVRRLAQRLFISYLIASRYR